MATGPERRPGFGVCGLLCAVALAALVPPVTLCAQETGVRRALLIGVGDYAVDDVGPEVLMGPADLAGPANDVALIRRVLTTRFGFRPRDVVSLVDAAADRAAVLAALRDLVAASGPADVVYIHFSGLGSRVADTSGDESDGWDDTILPHDARLPGVPDITDDELEDILRGLRAASAVVVLDAGHDPMPTAPGSGIRVRAAGRDLRAGLYDVGGATPVTPLSESTDEGGYVLFRSAGPGQYSLESPIEGGATLGWFSRALARTLDLADPALSVRDVLDRAAREVNDLGIRIGLRAGAPLIEGPESLAGRSMLAGGNLAPGGPGSATRAWMPAGPAGSGRAGLADAALYGGVRHSLWAIFPPGTDDFSTVEILATAEVDEVRGSDAIAAVDGGADIPEGSRAVLVAPAPPVPETTVWLRKVDSGNRNAVQEAIRTAARGPVRFSESAAGARFIVNIDERGMRVFGPGGLQEVARFEGASEDGIRALAATIDRASAVAHVQALNNPSGGMSVRLEVNPIDVDGMPRVTPVAGAPPVPTFRVRRPGEARAPDNSLMMSVRVGRPAYITIVDVGPEGGVVQLFPNPVSDQRLFFQDGFVPGGTEIRIPDSLVGGTAGFYIDYEPPAGADTVRVFVTPDPVTAERLREYVALYTVSEESGGKAPPFTEIFLPLENDAVAEVGTADTGFGAGLAIGAVAPRNFVDWTATSVSFRITE